MKGVIAWQTWTDRRGVEGMYAAAEMREERDGGEEKESAEKRKKNGSFLA